MSAPKRIQLSRRKGWRLPDNAVSVARPTKWGNPWVVGTGSIAVSGSISGTGAGHYDPNDPRWYDLSLDRGLTAAEAVALYEVDLREQLRDDDPAVVEEIRTALAELAGKDLACWCKIDGRPCHGVVLLEFANR